MRVQPAYNHYRLAAHRQTLDVFATPDGCRTTCVLQCSGHLCRPGYNVYVCLFAAPATYQLRDLLSWPETDDVNSKKLPYVWVSMQSAES